MNDTGHHATFSAWLKGDARTDSWKSDWLRDFERRSAEDKGKPQRVSAPQIKARQKLTPQPPRYCAVCTNRLNHGNTCGYCKLHTPKTLKKAA
jgi:hypothetical protein